MLKSELDMWKQRQGGGEMRWERCTKDWVRRGEGKVKPGMIHSSGSELLLTKKLQEKWKCNGTWTRCALLCIQYIQPYLVASHLSCCLMLSCLFLHETQDHGEQQVNSSPRTSISGRIPFSAFGGLSAGLQNLSGPQQVILHLSS